ncbi:MAG: CHAT domain-containing protein, partial [Caldilineaceae bacterium]|nr:CHAT domain-containing protein [Caldilineaceae bacterium]
GRYADALQAFDGATYDLLGTLEVDRVPERWPVADVLFLEQAIAFLAVNLLPEAASTLDRAEALFRQSAQRYELMQTLYYRALLALRLETAAAAQRTLSEAATLATAMDNAYWQNHIRLAQSLAMSQAGETAAARAALADLTAWQPPAGREGALHWDAPLRAEAGLLALHEALEDGDIGAARRHAREVAATLGLPPDGGTEGGAYPHLRARLLHGLGRIERAAGGTLQARTYLSRALDAVEAQRATLPLEEFRTAFLTDKSDMYADLVLALLDSPAPDEDTVASAFAVVERARSRTLLERLLVSLDEATLAAGAPSPELSERMAAVRQQLYWLYNRLLGDEPGSRHATAELTAELNAHEGALRQLEWRAAPWLAQAEPVSLQALQAVLASDQQALLYYLAGEELMAFVASPNEVQVVRQIATAGEIQRALGDLRFQMGRVEVGSDYVARHRQRLMDGVRTVLHQLYNLVWAPVAPLVEARRALIAPYGPLHLLPFHALWDGQAYLLQRVELSYIPSASIEVHRRRRAMPSPYATLAGLALRDASIPQAEAEIQAAARYFRQATTYLDDAAGVVNLRRAAAEGDALHIATHGLFRPDNPFFSALKLADGWIDVHEIYRLPLRARLVVLSACESGAVQVQGSEEAIGLVRGFLGAGAESLVVSLWNVHDASAANLMERFYARLTDHDATPAAALRGAQIDTLRQEEHPYYWAPYIVIG